MELAASSSGSGLGTALLPVVALVASLIAAGAVGSLIVSWLGRPRDDVIPSTTDPETVGLLPVGYVSGRASNRWLPATVVELALAGAITIEDRRDGAREGSARDIRLVFGADLPAVHTSESADDTADLVIAMFAPGLTGGTGVVAHGASIPADRVVVRNGELVSTTRRRFGAAADVYRDPRPVGRFRAATIGGALAVGLGLLAVLLGEGGADSIAWIAIAIGAVALGVRALMPRWIPLNAAGLALRANAARRRDELAALDVRDPATAEAVLPWAVLFDQADVVARIADVLGSREIAPRWYSAPEGYRPDRVASCLALTSAALVQPITVGVGSGDGRFGVPLTEEYWVKQLRGGYFWDHGRFGGFAYDSSGNFDGLGGGFDGGGFDGGGGGGGDGGGGGGP